MTLGKAYASARPKISFPSATQETGEEAYNRIKDGLTREIESYAKKQHQIYKKDQQDKYIRLKSVAAALEEKIQLTDDGSIRFSLNDLISSVYKNQLGNKKATRTLKPRTKGDLVTILHGPNMTVTEEVGRGEVSYRLLIRYTIHNGSEFGYFYRRVI